MSPFSADHDGHEHGRVSRRLFLKGSGATIAAAGVGVPTAREIAAQGATPAATPAMQMPAGQVPAIEFFTADEAQMVEAITARILPGDASDPGAREAGVVFYIDRALSGANQGYHFKTYTDGPFLEVTEQEESVEAASRTDIYRQVFVGPEIASRYGYQSALPPQELYRRGLGFVDAYAQSKFGKGFVALSTDQQDQTLDDMANNKATGFDGPSAPAFFTQLRNDTIEGMFSDPIYGGNRNMAGWKLIGYPGVRGFYTGPEMMDPDFSAEPKSMSDNLSH
jgi:gluconate 2-dehydrogenase gamma chain